LLVGFFLRLSLITTIYFPQYFAVLLNFFEEIWRNSTQLTFPKSIFSE
jgi:hypothetical protein